MKLNKAIMKLRKGDDEIYFFPNDNGKILDGLIGDTINNPNEPKVTFKDWINKGDDVYYSPINQIK